MRAGYERREAQLAEGRDAAVGERLSISPHTASGHLRHAFGKRGINCRVGLTRIAAEHAKQGAPSGRRRPGCGRTRR